MSCAVWFRLCIFQGISAILLLTCDRTSDDSEQQHLPNLPWNSIRTSSTGKQGFHTISTTGSVHSPCSKFMMLSSIITHDEWIVFVWFEFESSVNAVFLWTIIQSCSALIQYRRVHAQNYGLDSSVSPSIVTRLLHSDSSSGTRIEMGEKKRCFLSSMTDKIVQTGNRANVIVMTRYTPIHGKTTSCCSNHPWLVWSIILGIHHYSIVMNFVSSKQRQQWLGRAEDYADVVSTCSPSVVWTPLPFPACSSFNERNTSCHTSLACVSSPHSLKMASACGCSGANRDNSWWPAGMSDGSSEHSSSLSISSDNSYRVEWS